MKQVFTLDDHDLQQLKKGHIYDIVLNGVAYGLAYHGRRTKRGVYKPKAQPPKRPSKGQASARFLKFFDTRAGGGVQCRHCPTRFKGRHHRVAAMTHFRRTHPDLWNKEKRA